ncbi:serine hydrolase [Spirosoma utsteinense]|uniref:beta-lactamase n=1 Tax=Spirosoma utsteinense TaxID=2585773 RepID=A0ABR6W3Q9_9BACT|nr:serine hydrolase [Spirosoma utsteinense]MBC3784737.1 D-alanyl-D-alanine carboxypeptidase [Spirosoma utsteinense]MBC3791227.1 D-alanyl-D-alanine carboxypeptidase [Spirosoma utsteinense]
MRRTIPFAFLAALGVLLNSFSTAALAQDVSSADDPVVTFIRANPARSAVFLVRNDTTLVSLRPDQLFPLASAVKTIVAIEFAKQAATGKIKANELIPIADTDRYYLLNTDGDAHPQWKANLLAQSLIKKDSVSLLEVAKGMIRYSSNANTEYLMDRLGLDAINANLRELGLRKHERLIYMVSGLMIYSTATKQATLQQVRALSAKAYEAQAGAIHQRLKQVVDGSFKKEFIFPDMDLQKLWSDRLTASTVQEYASVMQKLSKRSYYKPAVQGYLDQIMEWPFAVNSGNRQVYEHIGMKGGSTAFVLTNALYATTKDGNRSELVVFFNNLTPAESGMLQQNLNTFLINCVQTNRYRKTVAALIP